MFVLRASQSLYILGLNDWKDYVTEISLRNIKEQAQSVTEFEMTNSWGWACHGLACFTIHESFLSRTDKNRRQLQDTPLPWKHLKNLKSFFQSFNKQIKYLNLNILASVLEFQSHLQLQKFS